MTQLERKLLEAAKELLPFAQGYKIHSALARRKAVEFAEQVIAEAESVERRSES